MNAANVCAHIEWCAGQTAGEVACTNRINTALTQLAAQSACATTEVNLQAWSACPGSSPCTAFVDGGVAGTCPNQLSELQTEAGQDQTCASIVQALFARGG